MMSRYFVVVKIPAETIELLKKYFGDKFRREMSATHIHMSLLPPFYLYDDIDEMSLLQTVRETVWQPFEAKFIGIRKSEQRERKYLFLKVGPEEACNELSLLVEKELGKMVVVDKTPYLNGIVPHFEAHVTIDYDFEGEVPSDYPEISFGIDKVSVAKEVNGKWFDLG